MRRFAVAALAMMFSTAAVYGGEWLKGDLHNHSRYSDGDSAVAEILAAAETHHFDYFVITDHDSHMNGVPTHWHDPDYHSNTMVLLYGVEWTTGRGHANTWGTQPYDYTALWQANRAMDPFAAVAAAHEQQALMSINHPLRFDWRYPVVDGINCIEIWNGPMLVNQNYRAAHEFWDDVLMERRRVTGLGGSDTHHLHDFLADFTGQGQPTTWVYSEARTPGAILSGISAGHVSVSATSDTVRLDLTADVDRDGVYETIVGENVPFEGGAVPFRIAIVGGPDSGGETVEVPPATLGRLHDKMMTFSDMLWMFFTMFQLQSDGNVRLITIVADSEPVQGWLVSGGTDEVLFEASPDAAGPSYYRAELYGEVDILGVINRLIYGNRLALTNPIYFNY